MQALVITQESGRINMRGDLSIGMDLTQWLKRCRDNAAKRLCSTEQESFFAICNDVFEQIFGRKFKEIKLIPNAQNKAYQVRVECEEETEKFYILQFTDLSRGRFSVTNEKGITTTYRLDYQGWKTVAEFVSRSREFGLNNTITTYSRSCSYLYTIILEDGKSKLSLNVDAQRSDNVVEERVHEELEEFLAKLSFPISIFDITPNIQKILFKNYLKKINMYLEYTADVSKMINPVSHVKIDDGKVVSLNIVDGESVLYLTNKGISFKGESNVMGSEGVAVTMAVSIPNKTGLLEPDDTTIFDLAKTEYTETVQPGFERVLARRRSLQSDIDNLK